MVQNGARVWQPSPRAEETLDAVHDKLPHAGQMVRNLAREDPEGAVWVAERMRTRLPHESYPALLDVASAEDIAGALHEGASREARAAISGLLAYLKQGPSSPG